MGIVMQADKLAMSGSSEAPVQHADPRQLLLNVPMSRFQVTALFVTLALCALDGFDVLAITFAAPALLPEFGIGKAQLGYALSAGLLGMAMGSLLFSPLADVVGRRRMLLASPSAPGPTKRAPKAWPACMKSPTHWSTARSRPTRGSASRWPWPLCAKV